MDNIFGRLNEDGSVAVLHVEDGLPVTRLDVAGIYPVGSSLGAQYEHPDGINVTIEDARRLGLTDDNGVPFGAAAALGRLGGKAGRGEAKRRGDSAYYRALRAKRRLSCPRCGSLKPWDCQCVKEGSPTTYAVTLKGKTVRVTIPED